ncbi:MAG: hypothetical protein AAF968_13970, partial [Pseudomonadota bacterium]
LENAMTDKPLDRESCLALLSEGADTPAACAAILENAPPLLSQREEGALILVTLLALTVLGHFLLRSAAARRKRLRTIRDDDA